MSEEIKSLKNYISTTKNEIFTTFKIETISNLIIYYEDLQQKVEQLENIRKEAIEELSYMSTDAYVEDYDIREKHYNLLMNILNKGSEKE